jgi:hypothetical protein
MELFGVVRMQNGIATFPSLRGGFSVATTGRIPRDGQWLVFGVMEISEKPPLLVIVYYRASAGPAFLHAAAGADQARLFGQPAAFEGLVYSLEAGRIQVVGQMGAKPAGEPAEETPEASPSTSKKRRNAQPVPASPQLEFDSGERPPFPQDSAAAPGISLPEESGIPTARGAVDRRNLITNEEMEGRAS